MTDIYYLVSIGFASSPPFWYRIDDGLRKFMCASNNRKANFPELWVFLGFA
jgi:hypothetical protein